MTMVLEELRKAHEGLAHAKEKEAIARGRLERMRVAAPQDGRVQLRLDAVVTEVSAGM